MAVATWRDDNHGRQRGGGGAMVRLSLGSSTDDGDTVAVAVWRGGTTVEGDIKQIERIKLAAVR
jgi:hypothetical protein